MALQLDDEENKAKYVTEMNFQMVRLLKTCGRIESSLRRDLSGLDSDSSLHCDTQFRDRDVPHVPEEAKSERTITRNDMSAHRHSKPCLRHECDGSEKSLS